MNPGNSATAQTATHSAAVGHGGSAPPSTTVEGVISRAPASITHAKYSIGPVSRRARREKNQ